MRRCLLLITILLLGGCLKQPDPWKPGGEGGDVADPREDSLTVSDTESRADRISPDGVAAADAVADGGSGPDGVPTDACVPYCEEWFECGEDGCGGTCGQPCGPGLLCFEYGCVDAGDECEDGNEVPWDGCTNGFVREFVVNSYKTMDQWQPDVARLSNGGYVVVWASCPDPDPDDGGTWSEGQDGSGCGIYGQLFNDDGKAFLSEFQVNWTTTFHQRAPRAAALGGGGFMVAWKGWEDIENWQTYARTFDEYGDPVSTEWQVSKSLDALDYDAEPALCAFSNGRFAMAWDQWDDMDQGYNVVFVTVEASGEPAMDEWELESIGLMGYPELVALGGETILALWEADRGATDGDIIARIIDFAVEEPGDELTVNTGLAGAQSYPSAAAGPNDHFVVVWQSDSVDEDGPGVAARFYNENWTAPASEVVVNHTGVGPQGRPDVATFGDNYVVVWHHAEPEGSGQGIMGQLFETDGTKMGGEFKANYYESDILGPPAVAATDDGFVVVWHSCWSQDDTGCGVFAQRYDSTGNKQVH